ncbi:MAG: hypothetical protein ACPH74_06465, partial [Candidatus Puniceispirillum sp.]
SLLPAMGSGGGGGGGGAGASSASALLLTAGAEKSGALLSTRYKLQADKSVTRLKIENARSITIYP